MRRALVIGGGVAGMAAAIEAARSGERVTVLERNRKPLKKLGVTGNGRGNLMNLGKPRYFGGESFALEALRRFGAREIRGFWESAGVTLTREEERAYPAALLSSVAVDALLLCAARLNVEIRVLTQAVEARRLGAGFEARALRREYAPDKQKAGGKLKAGELLRETEERFQCDRLIVAVGGAAAPAHGTDGTGYALLTGFGHPINPPRPALCALRTAEAPLAGLDGQRARARLTLIDAGGAEVFESAGEALFAKDGVSGIAAMRLARFVTPGCLVRIDLREAAFGASEAERSPREWLEARVNALPGRALGELLLGAVTPALSRALLRYAGVADASRLAAQTPREERNRLADALAGFTLPVYGTRGFEFAQVTAGGVQTEGFDPNTMQSKLVPGLYAAGEALDVDGDCGGHNLMFAVASGALAGRG